jgi:hypothetical protein
MRSRTDWNKPAVHLAGIGWPAFPAVVAAAALWRAVPRLFQVTHVRS